MKTPTHIKVSLHWRLIWLATYSVLLSTGMAQSIDTLLMAPNKPSAHDAPAYISSIGHRVAIAGNFVYLADGYAGLEVYKLGGEDNARLVGEYHTGEYTRTVRLNGDRVYAEDSLNGTVVFHAHHPMKLRPVALSDVSPEAMARAFRDDGAIDSGSINGVAAIVGHRVYIAREDQGVAVIEMRSPPGLPPPPFRNRVVTYRPAAPGSASAAGPQVVRIDLGSMLAEPAAGGNRAIDRLNDAPGPATEPVVVVSPSHARLELASSIEAGTLRLWISSPPGRTVHVQRSSALLGDWEEWQAITVGEAPEDMTDADQLVYWTVSP